jgi:HEPN domain-containing protein
MPLAIEYPTRLMLRNKLSTGVKARLEDWEVAVKLVKDGKSQHGLLFAHLALEKVLKALVCRHTHEIPPRIHNLTRLSELAGRS